MGTNQKESRWSRRRGTNYLVYTCLPDHDPIKNKILKNKRYQVVGHSLNFHTATKTISESFTLQLRKTP